MSVSFVRIDDRMVHSQTVARWSLEYPCDGIVAVNDQAATNAVLKATYKAAAPDKKIFVWTMDHFLEFAEKVRASESNYFLVTKNPHDMREILVEAKFDPGVRTVFVGPTSDRPGAVLLGNNQSVSPLEAQAYEDIAKAGYDVEFALIKEAAIGPWSKFRDRFDV